MRKIIAVLLSAILLFAITGCKKEEETVHSNPQVVSEAGVYPILKPEYLGKIKIKMMGANHAAINPDWANNEFFKRMKEFTGLDFDFEVYGDDMYAEKKSLSLSTGNNLPDVFFKANFSNYDEVTYGGKSLRALNDLIDQFAPNIKKLLDENPVIKKCITTTDGKIYSLPTIYINQPEGIENTMRAFFWINQKWLTDLNLEMPSTPDEFLTVLRAFKQSYCVKKNDYPLVIAGIDELMRVFNFFGLDMMQHWVQIQEGKKDLLFGPETEEFKRSLAFIRTMIDEELMNPNWATLTPAQKNATGNSGDLYGCFVDAAPQYVVGFGKMRQFVTMDPIAEEGKQGFWGATYPVQRGCFSITRNCEYPEACIRWIDCLYDISLPCGQWATVGEENKEWKWLDDEKTQWMSTVPDQQYAQIMAKTIIQTGDGMPYAVDESFWEKQKTESDTYTRPLRNKQMRQSKVCFPYIYFNSKNLKTMSDLSADINSYINQFIAKSITTDGYLEKEWDNFIRFDRLQLDTYLSLLQERCDAFYA